MSNKEVKYRAYIKETNQVVDVEAIYLALGSQSGKDIVALGNWYSIEEVELLQFTGLKDESNKNIYEGDIVCETYEGVRDIGLVYFSEGMFKVNFQSTEDFALSGCDLEQTEVIGNVFMEKEKYKDLYEFYIL